MRSRSERRGRHTKSRVTTYREENEYNPETIPQNFQISVNVLEARKLAWSNPQSANSYVILFLGKKKHRTTVRRNMEDPVYREYFVFEMYISIREIQRSSLWLAVMEPRCYAPPKLIGETTIDLGAVWAQPHHQVYHKWAQLFLPRELSVGPTGFLKVDISITLRGEVQVMPAIINSGEKGEENLLLPTGLEQQLANYLVSIYGAFGLPSGSSGNFNDHRNAKTPNTFVRVSFCGLVAKTAVQHRTHNPMYCEQISIVEQFPNINQIIRLEVCSSEGCFNRVIASSDLKLSQISHDGDNGFLPTFGPSLLHMYAATNGVTGASSEDGPFHRGALLVALKTIVPYYQQGVIRNISVEPIPPIVMENLWSLEDFCIFCPIFEVSMLDRRFAGKTCGVAISIGEFPNDKYDDEEFLIMKNELKSRKLHYTGGIDVYKSKYAYSYMHFHENHPVLQIATRMPDFRFSMYRNNMVHQIIAGLESVVTEVERRLKQLDYAVPNDLAEKLNKAIDDAAGNIIKYLDIVQYFNRASSEDTFNNFATELDQKQLDLQKEEIEKIYHQITKKTRESMLNVIQSISRKKDGNSCSRKSVKLLLAETKTLVQDLKNIIFKSPEGWPDIVLWLLSGGSRVAYAKVSPSTIIYSVIPEQCGRFCGDIQNFYFKPLKCSKHATSSSCYCVAGKIELLFWMGLFRQTSAFTCNLPYGYVLNYIDYDMHVKCVSLLIECRVYIYRAKFITDMDGANDLNTFVRVNTINAVKETKVQLKTSTPVWNQVLKIQKVVQMTAERLVNKPPVVLIEVLEDNCISEKVELVGRFEIQPEVDERTGYETPPKLQWYEIYKGAENTGQILMSVQMLKVTEKLMKTTNYAEEGFRNSFACVASIKESDVVSDSGVESLPSDLIPDSNSYKVDIYWWGLRDVNITRKPCVVLEIDDVTIKSEIIADKRPNCNFPNGRSTDMFEAPLSGAYSPSLSIRLYDSSTFGRTLFLGTNVVKYPTKYVVNWVPKFERESSLDSAPFSSPEFCQISQCLFVKKFKSEDNEDCSSSLYLRNLPQTKVKGSRFRKWFSSKEPPEEEFTLLPVYVKEKDKIKVVKKNSKTDEMHDWWTRFFNSCKDVFRDGDRTKPMNSITIYDSELELQSEFSRFKDWCSTIKLYNGKKTGIPDKDEQLHCGYLKAGIAIYRWPPPENTVVVNAHGVDLRKGFFADYPENEPSKYLVRVYIVKGLYLTSKDINGTFDPYVIINCGKKKLGDRDQHVAHTTDPIFGKMYEFRATLPDDYLLSTSIYNYDSASPDELIGTTTIDIEDRVYSKHRACVGLALEYNNRNASARWRDCVTPSMILEELCEKNHLPPPIFNDNTSVFVNGVEYRDNISDKNYSSSQERIENICLSILHKWHTLRVCGYHLVPEHIETRTLYHPDKPGLEQGKIQMWVDIFPLNASPIPVPVDIAPRKMEEYELRVVVWDVQSKLANLKSKNIWKSIDLYVNAWIGDIKNVQYTDVHFNSNTGHGHFNWRMIFHFLYHHAERKILNRDQGPFTEYEEYVPPVLFVQLMENTADKCLGSLSLDLNQIPRGTKLATQCTLNTMRDSNKINLFSKQCFRAWWPLKIVDGDTLQEYFTGVIDLEMTLLPKEKAVLMPVGVGRSSPAPLPEPSRPSTGNAFTKYFSTMCQFCKQSPSRIYCLLAVLIVLILLSLVRTSGLCWARQEYMHRTRKYAEGMIRTLYP